MKLDLSSCFLSHFLFLLLLNYKKLGTISFGIIRYDAKCALLWGKRAATFLGRSQSRERLCSTPIWKGHQQKCHHSPLHLLPPTAFSLLTVTKSSLPLSLFTTSKVNQSIPNPSFFQKKASEVSIKLYNLQQSVFNTINFEWNLLEIDPAIQKVGLTFFLLSSQHTCITKAHLDGPA